MLHPAAHSIQTKHGMSFGLLFLANEVAISLKEKGGIQFPLSSRRMVCLFPLFLI